MAEIYKVDNASAAVRLAQEFKSTGRYDLFRGQGKNWPVVSSMGRLSADERLKAIDKIKRLFSFFQTDPSLLKYSENYDWFYAVAQHYGLPTSYIDFTNNIEVAAYFATNASYNVVGEDSVIICVNEKDYIEFTGALTSLYERDKVLAPYFAKINVDNLWRLQAQHGCFLYAPYSQIEFLYDFDRITFPYSEPIDSPHVNDIYPIRKSELEILLDHYFNAEERREGSERFVKFTEEVNIPVTQLGPLKFDRYLKNSFFHKSWKSAEIIKWQYATKEEWLKYEADNLIKLKVDLKKTIDFKIGKIVTYLKDYFFHNQITRNTQLDFAITTYPRISNKAANIINRSCQRIWDGTRNLPFTDDEIFTIIGKYICLEIIDQKYPDSNTLSLSGEKLVVLELMNEYGSITRAYLSPSIIMGAIREDIDDILIDELLIDLNPEILLLINDPRYIFDFIKLIEAFKTELIAYQVLYNSEKLHPVIFYYPTQVTILGYA